MAARRLVCDHAVATADWIRTSIVGVGLMAAERVTVIGEWAGDAFFDTAGKDEHRASVRTEFSIPDGRPLVTVVGMLRGDKAQENLILTVAEMCRRKRPVHGLLVGSGIHTQPEYKKGLRAHVTAEGLSEFITFAGYRDDVDRLTQAADVLAITSIAVEAQSRTAPEAFASLTPVVASTVGGLPELVRPGETGWLVPPARPDAYADALEEILDYPDETAAIVARARAFAETELRIDARMAATLGVYESVAGERKTI